MSRFIAMWFLTSCTIGSFIFLFSKQEKIATIKVLWRAVAIIIISAVLVSVPLLLNNIQGL